MLIIMAVVGMVGLFFIILGERSEKNKT
jgi:hypothetical protein